MSMLEVVVDLLSSLPAQASAGMQELRESDKKTRNMSIEILKEETELLKLLQATIKSTPNFDEEPFLESSRKLAEKRVELGLLLDEQSKIAQNMYRECDLKISAFDAKTKSISYLFPVGAVGGEVKTRKRKNNAVAEENEYIAISDPNEPLYCICKRISFGQMIGCDNVDCEVEWFHMECCGIKEGEVQPSDWYCPNCRISPDDAYTLKT